MIPIPDFPHFYYMLGGNMGSLLYEDVSVIIHFGPDISFILAYCDLCFCFSFFVSFLLNVPVNNFSVMSGRSHRFLDITSKVTGR